MRFHASPQMAARFAQALLELAPGGGTERPFVNGMEHFYYVVDGSLRLTLDDTEHVLAPGGFAFVPQGAVHAIATADGARAVWIKKPWDDDAGLGAPSAVVRSRSAVPAVNRHTEGRTWQFYAAGWETAAYSLHKDVTRDVRV